MIGLAVSIGHAAVALVSRVCEGHYDDVLDGVVSWLVVLVSTGGVECIPCGFVG